MYGQSHINQTLYFIYFVMSNPQSMTEKNTKFEQEPEKVWHFLLDKQLTDYRKLLQTNLLIC